MIAIVGKPGDELCRIRFTPRPLFKDDPKVEPIERDLVYGHVCPTCENVIQACFVTAKPVNLWLYEETAYVLRGEKTYGELQKYVPNEESKYGQSQYTSTFERTKTDCAQHLVMKNHIVRHHGHDAETRESSRFFEPGGHACPFTGCFSLREDLLLKDLCLMYRCNESGRKSTKYTNTETLDQYDFGKLTEELKEALRLEGIRVLPAYGQAPPVLSFDRNVVTQTYPPFYNLSRHALESLERKETI